MDNNTYTKTFSINTERINYHHKCRQRKIKRLIVVLLVWLIILIYFVTPFSKINIKINGNVYYSKEEIMNMAYINKNGYWWLLDKEKAIKVLESYEYINNVEITKSPFGTKVEIDEIYPIGIKNNKYILDNGNFIDVNEYPNNSKITSITSFNNINDEDVKEVVNKYSKVPLEIRKYFYNVDIVGDSNDYKYVKLYGYDENIGYFIIKVDLVYLDNKFKENKYALIVEQISKNNVKYSEDKPCLVAYHYPDEREFHLVEVFEEE